MKVLNSNRFLNGAANRISGIQLTPIEPCNVIVFTENASKYRGLERLMEFASSTHLAMYSEIFQWD